MSGWVGRVWRMSWDAPVRGWRWCVLATCLVAAVACYFHLGAHLIAKTNRDRLAGDQQAAIELARASRGDVWPMRTNAVSNNLWAWISLCVWSDDDAVFFRRGRWLNVTLCGAALAWGGLILGRYLPLMPAVAIAWLAGFAVFLPRAVFFQPEPVYYILFAGAWIVGGRLLVFNPIRLYALFGLLFGFAYLAKPSALPLLVVWGAVGLYRLVTAWLAWRPVASGAGVPARRTGASGCDPPAGGGGEGDVSCPGAARAWCGRRQLWGMLVAAAVAGAVLAPRAWYGVRHFGAPFFGMTGYWMWQDDYGRECVPFLVRYAHRDRIASLPRDQVPSLGRYLRTHTAEQVWRRLSDGTGAKLAEWLMPGRARPGRPWRNLVPERGVYLAALLALWMALALGAVLRRLPIIRSAAAGSLVLYHLGAAAFYVVLYGWYHPIGRGDRFLMSLYLPLTLALALGIERLRREHRSAAANWASVAVYGWMLVGLALRVGELMVRPEFDPKHPL